MNAHESAHPTRRRPLRTAEVEHLALTEMPELTGRLRSTAPALAHIHQVNSVDPQHDLAGLHAVMNKFLDPLIRQHPSHRAVTVLAEFGKDHPTTEVPLLTKAVMIGLLSDAASNLDHDPYRQM